MTDKGDYVKILFKHNAFDDGSVESAWAKKLEEGYQLDNILFYAKNYSWGDIIKADEQGGELYAKELMKEMGHTTVRVLVSEVRLVAPLRKELKTMGCSSELSNVEKLIAVDIPPEVLYSKIKDYLERGEKSGKWEYEEACIASNHKQD